MMTVPCYLAPSPIEGLGVFSRVDIRKGDLVWLFLPEFDRLIPVETYRDGPDHIREFMERYTYPHPAHPGMVVLDADESRFMNHSDTPNVDLAQSDDHGYAVCDIPAGTELTCDYATFVDGAIRFQPPRHAVSVLMAAE